MILSPKLIIKMRKIDKLIWDFLGIFLYFLELIRFNKGKYVKDCEGLGRSRIMVNSR